MTTPLGWWAISGEAILEALRRVAAGEDPDIIYAELYANSTHEHPPPRCEAMSSGHGIDPIFGLTSEHTPVRCKLELGHSGSHVANFVDDSGPCQAQW